MMYYGHGMGVGWILVVAVVVPALLLAVVLLTNHARRTPGGPDGDAERVLAGRLARGEIDPEEYEQRLRTLRAARP